jgi:hypothetical protein
MVLIHTSFTAVGASVEERGKSFCDELEKKLDAFVDYTRTACIPTRGSGEHHSFILISEQPVFSVDVSKKGWVIGIVGLAVSILNQNTSLKAEELWLNDVDQMKARTAYFMPASLAGSLQRRAKADQSTFEALYAEALGGLKRQTIPENRQAR